MEGRFETYVRPERGLAALPTNDGLTLVVAGWPHAEMAADEDDLEGNYLKTVELAASFAARLRDAKRETHFAGVAVPNYFRKPYGPGWALVGDAGYNRDFITAQGIADAFHDAELCANALDDGFARRRSFEDAMSDYQQARDERVAAMYDFTCELASLKPPPPQMQQLIGAIAGNQQSMDGFIKMNAGTISPTEFMSPENIGRIMAS